MKLKARAVEIAGIICHPNEMSMTQLARNLLDAGDGFLRGVQYLILTGSALLHRLSAPAAGQRREATPAARAESEPERVCRAVCLVRQVRVIGPSTSPETT